MQASYHSHGTCLTLPATDHLVELKTLKGKMVSVMSYFPDCVWSGWWPATGPLVSQDNLPHGWYLNWLERGACHPAGEKWRPVRGSDKLSRIQWLTCHSSIGMLPLHQVVLSAVWDRSPPADLVPSIFSVQRSSGHFLHFCCGKMACIQLSNKFISADQVK